MTRSRIQMSDRSVGRIEAEGVIRRQAREMADCASLQSAYTLRIYPRLNHRTSRSGRNRSTASGRFAASQAAMACCLR